MDFEILYALNAVHSGFLDKLMIGITYLGEKGIFWICVSIILIVFKKTRKCGLFMLISMMLGLIFGNEFIDSYNVTRILVIGVYSMIFYKIIGQLFISDNKSKQYFIILFIGTIVNIIANIILIPKMDIIGAAIASVFSYSAIGIIFLVMYQCQYNVNIIDVLIVKKSDFNNIKKVIFRK